MREKEKKKKGERDREEKRERERNACMQMSSNEEQTCSALPAPPVHTPRVLQGAIRIEKWLMGSLSSSTSDANILMVF